MGIKNPSTSTFDPLDQKFFDILEARYLFIPFFYWKYLLNFPLFFSVQTLDVIQLW